MQYYSLISNYSDQQAASIDVQHLRNDGSWHDVWIYSRCVRSESITPFKFTCEDGLLRDFNIAVFNIPLVSEKFKQLIEGIGDNAVQFVRTIINGEPLYVMNVLERYDALDCEKSVLTFRTPKACGDAKEISGVIELKVDSMRARGGSVFRLEKWNIPIIVSEELRLLAEEECITGAVFEKV